MTTQDPFIQMEVLEQAADVLRVLAHPHRLRIVELLEGQRLSVGQLAERLELAPAAVSQHLGHMKAHGILAVEREGRAAYYQVANLNAHNVIRCIREHGCGRAT
ncbi:MAG: ArsR/SmtB family transcription factor [Phycisphaeraceae bacterium]